MAVFEDEEKARLLEQLLKSKNQTDLQAANRLIKSMVRAVRFYYMLFNLFFKLNFQEDLKIEREHKRAEVLETAATNVRVLQDMLEQTQNNSLFTNSEQNEQDFVLMKVSKVFLKLEIR